MALAIKEKNISIVILSHNRCEDVKKNLITLLTPDVAVDEIIVVDNASTDQTRPMLAEITAEHQKLRVVLLEKNLGVAGGRNAGFNIASGKYVVSLDDDSSIDPKEIKRVPEIFARYPKAGILAFRIIHPKTGCCQNEHGNYPTPVANHHGAGFAVRRVVFEKVGTIDEKCAFGAEELDLCIKAHSSGYQTIYIPDLVILHNSRIPVDKENFRRRKLRVYNYIRTNYKYFPEPTASLFSFRYTARHFLSAFRLFGFLKAFSLLPDALRGRNDGLLNHQPVNLPTLRFYKSPGLWPDFGSIPLTTSLNTVIKKKIARYLSHAE